MQKGMERIIETCNASIGKRLLNYYDNKLKLKRFQDGFQDSLPTIKERHQTECTFPLKTECNSDKIALTN